MFVETVASVKDDRIWKFSTEHNYEKSPAEKGVLLELEIAITIDISPQTLTIQP